MALDQFTPEVSVLSLISFISCCFLSLTLSVWRRKAAEQHDRTDHSCLRPRQSICSLSTWFFSCQQLLWHCTMYRCNNHLYSVATASCTHWPVSQRVVYLSAWKWEADKEGDASYLKPVVGGISNRLENTSALSLFLFKPQVETQKSIIAPPAAT